MGRGRVFYGWYSYNDDVIIQYTTTYESKTPNGPKIDLTPPQTPVTAGQLSEPDLSVNSPPTNAKKSPKSPSSLSIMTVSIVFCPTFASQSGGWSDLKRRSASLVTGSLYETCSILRQHHISLACILLWSSAVRVHDSQAQARLQYIQKAPIRYINPIKMF